jgi:hypothetical protein
MDWLTWDMPYPDFAAVPECFGLGICEPSPAYCPRRPEESVLYGVVAENLETFLARHNERDRPVPRFVETELRSFLECGILAYGGRPEFERSLPYACARRDLRNR